MSEEIKEILDKLQKVANRGTASRNALMEMKDKDYQLLLDYITNLQEEIEELKNLCDKYEEEHRTTFEEWKKTINIINELEKWLDKKEKLTFNSWNKGIHEVQRKLQELRGSDKE